MATRCPRCGYWMKKGESSCPVCGFTMGTRRSYRKSHITGNPL